MLKFRFTPVGEEAVIDGLTPGHIIVADGDTEYDSSHVAPPMFLVQSVYELLAGVLQFLTSNSDKEYVFQSMYGGYGIRLMKSRNDVLTVFALDRRNYIISRTTSKALRAALWEGVEQLCRKYLNSTREPKDDFTERVEIRTEFEALIRRWTATFPELRAIVNAVAAFQEGVANSP